MESVIDSHNRMSLEVNMLYIFYEVDNNEAYSERKILKFQQANDFKEIAFVDTLPDPDLMKELDSK